LPQAHQPLDLRLSPWLSLELADLSEALGGQLVFVDVTADWCFTCKVNERLVLSFPEVAGLFAERGSRAADRGSGVGAPGPVGLSSVAVDHASEV